jgi:hypothetical protein
MLSKYTCVVHDSIDGVSVIMLVSSENMGSICRRIKPNTKKLVRMLAFVISLPRMLTFVISLPMMQQ